jgi:hypothetical protein
MVLKEVTDMTLTAHRNTTTTIEDGFDSAYQRLVDARLSYEMLKSDGAPLADVVGARGSLHQARARMAAQRRSTI